MLRCARSVADGCLVPQGHEVLSPITLRPAPIVLTVKGVWPYFAEDRFAENGFSVRLSPLTHLGTEYFYHFIISETRHSLLQPCKIHFPKPVHHPGKPVRLRGEGWVRRLGQGSRPETLTYFAAMLYTRRTSAGVAELVDARDSKSRGLRPVRVRLPPPAPWTPRA